MKKIFLSSTFIFLSLLVSAQSIESTVKERLDEYFRNYKFPTASIPSSKLKNVQINQDEKTLTIYPDDTFGYQPFTPEIVNKIYDDIKKQLPGPTNYFDIKIISDGKPIEELIPNSLLKKKDKNKLWKQSYEDNPWVKNISRPYIAAEGLEGHHFAVWQSHGKYYKSETNSWIWQRPRLFCTTEDMFTQSFVVPYIIPMLQNAGAVVFTPRERDWQRNEVIVDNDNNQSGNIYYEETKKRFPWENTDQPGFANLKSVYPDNQNPFTTGSARFAGTTGKKKKITFAEWIPNIPETGKYAVYVSYQTLKNSVSDAHYTVFHKGGATEFTVNQKMGGGTWVYLGTFEFDKGNNDYGMVALSNESEEDGVVCADAIRFGGGMGNIERGGKTSGLPRFLEGARYNAQWSGMPYSIYGGYKGANDYNDDINTRSLMCNYLSGNSVYNPDNEGLGVPLEMTMAVHSDAGYSKTDDLIGTLGIYTTDFNYGKLNTGMSRYASRDLCDMVMTGIQNDIDAIYHTFWTRRAMWNRNYSESRLPAVPSMILETLSHQNFIDMKLGHDPNFKFYFSRAVYKSILKFSALEHGNSYCVQPLPINRFMISFADKKGKVRLSWKPVEDPLEPTAKAKEYIVYTRLGYGGFDNGVKVSNPYFEKKLEPDMVYSFKVTAVNKGGESFPSEILSACYDPHNLGTVLIVNNFYRLSGPATIETDSLQGFDMKEDPGVPYVATTEYCGPQLNYNISGGGKEGPDGLGYSGDEWEGKIIAGNTFDYPFIHGKAIQAVGNHSFVSCSGQALENGDIHITDYPIADIICGVQKAPFSIRMRQLIYNFLMKRGRLFVSGSNIGAYLKDADGQDFAKGWLHFLPAGDMHNSPSGEITGTGITFNIHRTPNEESYAVPKPDCLIPASGGFASFAYTDGNQPAGVAFSGYHRTFVLGFPFESVDNAEDRAHIMAGVLGFFK